MELLNTCGQSYRAIVTLLQEGPAEHQLLVWASWCHYQASKYITFSYSCLRYILYIKNKCSIKIVN
jgi:hypothetical protein